MEKIAKLFSEAADRVSQAAGHPFTFVCCCLLIVVWAITGPVVGFSDTWQLIINTGTTIITFLMVFLIQNTQNRENSALQAKLDELIRVTEAENHLIGSDKLDEEELAALRQALLALGDAARRTRDN